jgi:hypothetical protein
MTLLRGSQKAVRKDPCFYIDMNVESFPMATILLLRKAVSDVRHNRLNEYGNISCLEAHRGRDGKCIETPLRAINEKKLTSPAASDPSVS